jgi:hypothetical protein
MMPPLSMNLREAMHLSTGARQVSRISAQAWIVFVAIIAKPQWPIMA